MKNKVLIKLIAITVAFLTFNFQCRKGVGVDADPRYNFRFPVDIYSQKRTYTLADTVWLEADVTGKMLYDTTSGRNITMDTSYLSVTVYYIQMAATTTNPADGLCQIVSPTNNTVIRQFAKGAANGSLYQYGCGQTSFKWKLGFKPNYKGTYAVVIDRNGLPTFCNSVRDFFYATCTYQYKPTNPNRDVFDALPDSMRRNDAYGTRYFNEAFANRSAFMVKVE